MLVTTDRVRELTGKTVSADTIMQAQNLVEGYAGRMEVEIIGARDRELMSRATAYQAAYMQDNPDIVWEQAAIGMVQPAEGMVTFDRSLAAPHLSPHVVPLIRFCSWRNSRSVKVGALFGKVENDSWVTA